MYTKALIHDDQLRAQIVINHPGLYGKIMLMQAELILTNISKEPGHKLQDIINIISEVDRIMSDSCNIAFGILRYQQWLWFNSISSPFAHIIWFNMGVLLTQAGNFFGAVHAYKAALNRKPDFTPALVNIKAITEISSETIFDMPIRQ